MVFQVLLNRHVICLNHIWSYDVFDDQSLGRSYAIFPGSHDISCDRFPQSCVFGVTWLELGLGMVVKQLVIVRWVLGSFGNAFLVGMSFTRNMWGNP